MSDTLDRPNVISLENKRIMRARSPNSGESDVITLPSKTPIFDDIKAEANKLDQISAYQCTFDYEIYKNLELRYENRPIRGGIVMKTPFRLVNSHSTCQQCLYAFEIDTYGRGCIHDCVYCYAKSELTAHGYWNNPIPVPIDVNEVRKAFYLTFETDKKCKWRDLLARRIPLRIGSMSDSFMKTDPKYGVTQELLKILKYYNYPYIIFTRSDLVADDRYVNLLDRDLASVQFSMSSVNEELTSLIEPGASTPQMRLDALKKLSKEGFWTTVRINPLFPIHPDGYFSDPNFKWVGPVPKFDFTSLEMIDQIAEAGVPSILAGFVRLSSYALNNIKRVTGFDLQSFYRKDEVYKSKRDWHYSDAEIRYYYELFKKRSDETGIQFTTCYIGNGEGHFWKDQDLWSNKKDCCNVKDRVKSFKTDSRDISFKARLKYTNHKHATPNTNRLHDPLGEHQTTSQLRREIELGP